MKKQVKKIAQERNQVIVSQGILLQRNNNFQKHSVGFSSN